FGNMTRVQVCASSAERAGYTAPITLATYEYEGNVYNGRLAKMTYGNGDSVSYTYDAFDRQRTAAYNDVDRTTHEQKNVATYHYDYSSDNALTRQYATDSSGITEQYSYQYDSLGRLIHSRQSTGTGALIQSTQHMYDAANRMTSQTWQFGTGLYHQQYSYTGVKADGATNGSVDGTISAITTTIPGQSVITSTYGYNDLRQLTSKGVTVPDQNGTQTKVYDRSYTYDRIAVDSGNWMGTRLASTDYKFGSNSRSFTYTYDKAGNIKSVMASDSVGKLYDYDGLGQLVKETPIGLTMYAVTYAYDTAGNIRSITRGGTTLKSFGYANPSWPDLLTSVTANGMTKDILYEGQSRTSDLPSSGNPVTYYNGRDYHFDWSKGRQLTEAVVGGQTVKYAYDMAGVRSSKQVGDTTYTYTTLSGKVMRQQWGNKSLEFVYDDGNQPFAMIYKHGSAAELYYYLVNAQGDVAAILDSSGTMVASYNYDAWGSCTVYNSSDAAIGDLNPLRYRGYYYDAETGFYYLQSRYYDPAICRFINADTFATTDANGFLSANMFAYCENNPVGNSDSEGEFPIQVVAAAVSGVVNLATSWASAKATGQTFTFLDGAVAFVAGAVGVFGSAGRFASAAISGFWTAYSVSKNGGTIVGAISCGALSAGFSWLAFSNLAKFSSKRVDHILYKAATDASLGWGSNLIIAGATTAATAPRAPQKSKHKKNNVSEYRYAKEDHIRWKYYAEHFANIG
ncbi:MAG: RHS repeat-associated core domain-containing protein, partial [Oscillospiraceae bacterium]